MGDIDNSVLHGQLHWKDLTRQRSTRITSQELLATRKCLQHVLQSITC